jgi:hypothetical protein
MALAEGYIQSSQAALQITHWYPKGYSSVSIVSDYGLDDQSSIPNRGREFFF